MTLANRISLLMLGAAFALLVIVAAMRLVDNQDFAAHWRTLDTSALEQTFSDDLLSELPEPAIRYFRRAIAPNTPLSTSARLRILERRRLDPIPPQTQPIYQEFRATGIVAPHRGYVWEGRERTTWGFLTRATAFVDGVRFERELLFGLFSLSSTTATELSRTDLEARLLASLLCPAALLPIHGVGWEEAGRDRARVQIPLGEEHLLLDLVVDDDGRLLEAHAPALELRVSFRLERVFDGYTIPTLIRAESVNGAWELVVDSAWFKY